MQKVQLVFPDVAMLTEFIIRNKISHAEVNSRELSLTAFLSENEISIACTKYGGLLMTATFV